MNTICAPLLAGWSRNRAVSAKRLTSGMLLAFVLVFVSGCPQVFAPTTPAVDDAAIEAVFLKWNQIAVDTSGLDHTPPSEDEDREFAHQLGPTRSSRAMAIVHIAMFDALNAIVGEYESYTRTPAVSASTSVEAAIAQAAHDALVALYPSHAPRLALLLDEDLSSVPNGPAKDGGIMLGQESAAAILAMRDGDGSEIEEPYEFSDLPGRWRVDPINPDQEPLGPDWYRVKPFVINSATQFRCPPPPALTDPEYTEAYEEVKAIGGDGIITPTIRTEEQTQIGIFWAYDGTPSLCAPPRLYNQITTHIAEQEKVSGVELARLITLMNVGLADTAIAVWESKYYYDYWRPVTAIREADPGTGPTGWGDGNPETVSDPEYVPLCAPASNLAGPNFTPPFPAYPSGHAGFGGSLFQTLRTFFGRDDIAFTLVSDEFNGETVDSEGNLRPLLPRSYSSLSEAEEENGQSRIYLGIHWSFDKTEGIVQGRKVADHVFQNVFRPLR
jgi:hypothetical protein